MAAVSGVYSVRSCPYNGIGGVRGRELSLSSPASTKIVAHSAGFCVALLSRGRSHGLRVGRPDALASAIAQAKRPVFNIRRRALAAIQVPEGQEEESATLEEDKKSTLPVSSERERLVGEWMSRNMVEHSGLVMREVRPEDYNALVDVQSVAFHESTLPLEALNTLSLRMFRAEVMSILLQKYRASPAGRYICIVAMADVTKIRAPHCDDESSSEQPDKGRGGSGGGSSLTLGDDLMREMRARECGNAEGQRLVGVVDMAVLHDADVLQHLPEDEEEYVYLSGMAVAEDLRRRGVATALLAGAESMAAGVWGFNYAVLHVYEKNAAAVQLYARNGFTVVDRDPLWSSEWLGRPRRLLMIKRIA